MNVSVLIGTYGDEAWEELAYSRAYPSTIHQNAAEVLMLHDPASSVANVRNRLAERAKADWLCFLDADDQLHDGFVDAMQQAVARYGDEGLLLAPAVHYCRNGRQAASPKVPNAGRWPIVNECVIGTLVPRALFLEVGGFRELPSLEDYDLWLRCVKAGARIVHVPGAVYCADQRAEGRNRDQSTYARLREEHADVFAGVG